MSIRAWRASRSISWRSGAAPRSTVTAWAVRSAAAACARSPWLDRSASAERNRAYAAGAGRPIASQPAAVRSHVSALEVPRARSISPRQRPARAARRTSPSILPSSRPTRSSATRVTRRSTSSQGVRVMAGACRHRGVGLRAKGVPRQPTQGRVEGRRRVEAGQRRLGDRACRVDVALPRRELGRRRGQRSPVPARPRVGGRQRVGSTKMLGGVLEAALVGVDACTVDVEPDRGGTDRVQLEALVGGRGSLVPSPEVEEGLRDVPEQAAAVRPGHPEPPRDRISLAPGRQRLLGPPHAIEQRRQVRVTERDTLGTAESLGDGQPLAVLGDASLDLPGHRVRPAEDAECQCLLGGSRHGARDVDRLPGQITGR